jgi:hypothetical protein
VTKELSSVRGSSVCRCCGGNRLEEILDLGSHPLPAEYAASADDVLETFPLSLRICGDCALGQLGEYVLPERIFHETYPYQSSASSTWVEHARCYASEMISHLQLDTNSFVVEVASNDGYLLSEFASAGLMVLGVEPAKNVANIAISKGVSTVTSFFGEAVAKEIRLEKGCPDLVVANNVFAHVPDMLDFAKGLSALADDSTIITIENPSFATLMKEAFFDTIYHEHYSYLSAHAVSKIAESVDLRLFHVDKLSTHGGSNRYWLSRKKMPDKSVAELLKEEIDVGLLDPDNWASFAVRSTKAIEGLRSWLIDKDLTGATIVGYGAAHKGNTFLNAVGIAAKKISCVVDASTEKHGRYLPGSQLPVIAPGSLADANPTDVLILPWNIADEIAETIRQVVPKARIWVAQPIMREIT